MQEKDIFDMLPGKIGPARKLSVLIHKLQADIEQQSTNVNSQNLDVATNANGKQPSRETEYSPTVQIKTPVTENEKSPAMEIEKEMSSEFPKLKASSNDGPSQQFYASIPTYSPAVLDLLQKGEIYKEWDKFIEETAYYVLTLASFESKSQYSELGRTMYMKFPCIGHKSFSEPWGYFNKKLSQKVRNIRWRRNARGKDPVARKTKVSRKMNFDMEQMEDCGMSQEEAEKIMTEQLDKPKKEMDRALIVKTQRVTFKTRRIFLSKINDVDQLIKKYPILGKMEYIEKEFFQINPSMRKDALHDNFVALLSKLDKVFGFEVENEEEDADIFKTLEAVEKRIKYNQKTNNNKASLITVCKPSDVKLNTQKNDPPRLIVVRRGREVENCYVIGMKISMEASPNIEEALLELMYTYYAWDLTYPKVYQLLGFLQAHVLCDVKNKFYTCQNYLRFSKEFDDFKM